MKHRFIIFLLIVLSGCSNRVLRQEYAEQWHEYEARLYDIPIPSEITPDYRYLSYNDAYAQTSVAFFSSLDSEELVMWYAQQLDICGWSYDITRGGPELLIRGKKPKKWCSVSIRPSTSSSYQSHIVIFIGVKSYQVVL